MLAHSRACSSCTLLECSRQWQLSFCAGRPLWAWGSLHLEPAADGELDYVPLWRAPGSKTRTTVSSCSPRQQGSKCHDHLWHLQCICKCAQINVDLLGEVDRDVLGEVNSSITCCRKCSIYSSQPSGMAASIGQSPPAQTNKGSAVGGGAACSLSDTKADFLSVGLPEHLTATVTQRPFKTFSCSQILIKH